MDDPGGDGAVGEERGGHRLDPALGIDPEHVAAGAGGVRLRAEEVEHGARAKLRPARTDMLHGRVMGRREHEADAGFLDAARDHFGAEVDLDAERLQHVGRAGFAAQGTVAVLGDGNAGGCGDNRRGGRDVEGFGAVAAPGADDVDDILGGVDGDHLFAQDRDGGGDLADRLALDAEAHQEGADLAGRGFALHDGGHDAAHFLAGQILARGDLGEGGLDVHQAAFLRRNRG